MAEKRPDREIRIEISLTNYTASELEKLDPAIIKSAILKAIAGEIADQGLQPHNGGYDRRTYEKISHAKIIKPGGD
jgi:hypothetical protein